MEFERSQIDYNFSTLILTILSVVLAVIFGLIPLYQWFYKRYFQRPSFTFDINKVRINSKPNADYMPDLYLNPEYLIKKAPQTFTYEWKYKIILTNNSVHDAFFTEIELIGDLTTFSSIHKLDRNKPISSRERIEIPIKITEIEIVNALDRKDMTVTPQQIIDLKILLSFGNGRSKRRFYSLYDNNSKTILESNSKPKV